MSEISRVDIRRAAMDFLARREHSRHELLQKLQRRFAEAVGIEAVIDELAEENLQSDARFAEAYVRQRCQRGYGPLHIRQKMREKGLSDELVATYLYADNSLNWADIAKAVREKKFGVALELDYQAKAKQMRFLQYRGFDADIVRHTVDQRSSD
jgi:regulatory protein